MRLPYAFYHLFSYTFAHNEYHHYSPLTVGMGKTLQTIATILDNRPKLQHASAGAKHPQGANLEALQAEEKLWEKGLEDWKHEMVMNNVPKSIIPKARGKKVGGGARAGTLVICPVIALTQWKTEIEKFTEHGSLSVCIYHGSDRASDLPRDMLCKYDVVLTTYQVLEADMRKMISPNKVKCPNCGGKFKVSRFGAFHFMSSQFVWVGLRFLSYVLFTPYSLPLDRSTNSASISNISVARERGEPRLKPEPSATTNEEGKAAVAVAVEVAVGQKRLERAAKSRLPMERSR